MEGFKAEAGRGIRRRRGGYRAEAGSGAYRAEA
jgi:hypothetical protein